MGHYEALKPPLSEHSLGKGEGTPGGIQGLSDGGVGVLRGRADMPPLLGVPKRWGALVSPDLVMPLAVQHKDNAHTFSHIQAEDISIV